MPQTPKRCYLAGADLSAAAVELNDLFGWYALWVTGQHMCAPREQVVNWCQQVAKQADELTFALGLDDGNRPGPHFQDALLHLAVAWPHPEETTVGPDREGQARHMLGRLAREAQPELFHATERGEAYDPGRDVAWECIGSRLGAALRILQLLASRAGDTEPPKGRPPEAARNHLFYQLAGTYERLFGCLPSASSSTVTNAQRDAGEKRSTLPKGPALTWFRALLKLVGERASDALPLCAPNGPTPDGDLAALLGELVSLTATAARSKALDGLAHWIREASDGQARRPPEPNPEADDPDVTPTSFEAIFRRRFAP